MQFPTWNIKLLKFAEVTSKGKRSVVLRKSVDPFIQDSRVVNKNIVLKRMTVKNRLYLLIWGAPAIPLNSTTAPSTILYLTATGFVLIFHGSLRRGTLSFLCFISLAPRRVSKT